MRWNRAVVIGGSMAGLFAARVLSDHFNEVWVLERDTLPTDAGQRNGTPQARHLHQILASGQQVMEELFPQLVQDLADVGAPRLHWGINNLTFNEIGRIPSVPSGIITNTCSRVTLEHLIRRRLADCANVKILEQHRSLGLTSTDDGRTITGVQVEVGRGREAQTITGDLIVDATGRATRSPEWLEALGYSKPETTYINAHIGYSTCWFNKPDHVPLDFVMLNVLDLTSAASEQRGQRSGIITEIEGGRWVSILASNNKDYPPTDHDGFLEFARSLRSPVLYDMLRLAEPISPVYGSRSTYSIWRHYERLDRRPENYIITGDAACAFNPIYGQGMSVAAQDAKLLGQLLGDWSADNLSGFADHFQKRLAQTLVNPWNLATSGDKYQPTAEGDIETPSRLTRMADTYMGWVLQTLEYDSEVTTMFLRVMNMLEPPEALGRPGIMFRVLRHKLTGYSNMPPAEALEYQV